MLNDKQKQKVFATQYLVRISISNTNKWYKFLSKRNSLMSKIIKGCEQIKTN